MKKSFPFLSVLVLAIIFNACKKDQNNPLQSESQNTFGTYTLISPSPGIVLDDDQIFRIVFLSGYLSLNTDSSYEFSFKEEVTRRYLSPVRTDTMEVGHGGSFSRSRDKLKFSPSIGPFGSCGYTGEISGDYIYIPDCGHTYKR